MTTYNIGDKFELEVLDICSNTNGYDYLECLGPNDRLCKVYNILKCQYASVPNTIYAEVKSITDDGHPKFRQDEQRALQEHYPLGHYYGFSIADKKTDNNTQAQYYVIEDDFASHRWYSDDDLQIGDNIILEAKGITNKGFIRFEKRKEQTISVEPEAPKQEPVLVQSGYHPIFNGEEEGTKVEYKTSIVFVPGKDNQADIDKQMFNIVREIAAFMNVEGGTLYIGIHDKTREILGIANDYAHLNDGEDPYKDSYGYTEDGYQLKIRNTLVSLCSGYAGGLIDISFPVQDGVKYCKVVVAQAKRPVWVKGNMLFVRQGNQTRQMRGEEITFFVCERVGRDIMSIAGQEQNSNLSDEELKTLIHGAVKNAINERRMQVAAPQTSIPISEIKYWIVWFNDGTWVRQKEQSTDANIFKQIPVTQDASDLVVAFCHASGTVNTVKLGDFKAGVNQYTPGKAFTKKTLGKAGFNPNETPMEIFITHPSNLLAIYSADQGGTEYIKIHSLSDVNPTTAAKNQGSYIIPTKNGHVLQYKLISSIHKENLKSLVCPKKETTKFMGLDINNINITNELSFLSAL